MRVVLLTVGALVAVAAGAVALVGGGRADALRGALGVAVPPTFDAAAPPLPAVRNAARSIEPLRVPGGRALLARSPVRSDRVIVVAHGRGSLAGTIFARPERARWSAELLRAGYSIATADASGDAWGNDASVADYRALIAQLRRRGLDRVVVAGSSMGGLASLQLLRTVRPIAYVGIYPVFDLRSLFRLGRFAASIRTAYGFAGDALPAAAEARSPVGLPPLRGLPVLLWASPYDTVVPKVANADRLAAAARAAGGRVFEFTTRGEHGDDSNWDGRRLVALLDRAAALPVARGKGWRRPRRARDTCSRRPRPAAGPRGDLTSGRCGAPSRRGP